MNKIETKLPGVYVIEPQVIGDIRGYFMETWSTRDFEELGLHYDFVQDNQSFSAKKGTLRGLHFQKGEYSQAKLVRCVRGTVLDVAVDLRHESPTYLKWIGVELSDFYLNLTLYCLFFYRYLRVLDLMMNLLYSLRTLFYILELKFFFYLYDLNY